jgi:hypothetical protein
VATQKGIVTSQNIPSSGRSFLVADSPPPCFQDRWGTWACGHDHEASVALQDAYQYVEGWTAQVGS